MRNETIMVADGNEAAAYVAYAFTGVAAKMCEEEPI